ncbi:hypothetical protein JTY60_00065 [symbiont of Argiope bruennichi]|uniref:hypothetical protein n=1 Tax=symbiont of Argiope bruennichi TaxID=2810479 RepID=UPI003DA324E9
MKINKKFFAVSLSTLFLVSISGCSADPIIQPTPKTPASIITPGHEKTLSLPIASDFVLDQSINTAGAWHSYTQETGFLLLANVYNMNDLLNYYSTFQIILDAKIWADGTDTFGGTINIFYANIIDYFVNSETKEKKWFYTESWSLGLYQATLSFSFKRVDNMLELNAKAYLYAGWCPNSWNDAYIKLNIKKGSNLTFFA